MTIPKQPSAAHTVLAENVRQQKLRWFTIMSFKSIPNMYDNGIKVPRQGWIEVDPKKFQLPNEAQEAAAAKAKKEADAAAKTKKEADAPKVKGKFDTMKVPEILEYLKENNIEIEGVENLPKSEIIKLLNEIEDGNMG
jgi:hypothetical protein